MLYLRLHFKGVNLVYNPRFVFFLFTKCIKLIKKSESMVTKTYLN